MSLRAKGAVLISMIFIILVCVIFYTKTGENSFIQFRRYKYSWLNDDFLNGRRRTLLSEETINDCITSEIVIEKKESLDLTRATAHVVSKIPIESGKRY